jgi:hypothetical protein
MTPDQLRALAEDLLDRIERALERHVYGHAARRIPADPSDSDIVLYELRKARVALATPVAQPLTEARSIAAEQAKDEGLWFCATTITEAYLQQELRRLTAAIEGDKQ